MTVQLIDECAVAPTSVLDRVSVILEAFRGRDRLTLVQVTARTGIPRSTAHRLLDQLVRMGWINRAEGSYELGFRLFELGSVAAQNNRIRACAEPTLHELYRATGFLVHLGILDAGDVVYLDKIGGHLARAVPTRVGGRRSASLSPMGRVLTAFASPEPRARATADPELRRVVDTGVAYDKAEHPAGLSCIAAPIGPVGGPALAAVSISGPSSHLKCDHLHSTPVRMAASAIWKSIQGASVGARQGSTQASSSTGPSYASVVAFPSSRR